MKIFKTQEKLQEHLSAFSSDIIGFVPTMGALHQGHLSLIKSAKQNADIVVCSIFVNPTQFNDLKDFEKYPQTHEKDISLLENNGCDILYLPESVEDVYLNDKKIKVDLGKLATVMEGANRPGHFDGVVQVVSVLFDIVKPNKAFFGLKDFQQYSIIQKMVQELSLNIEIVGCDIIRESNGLAMSSRNMRLNDQEKKDALIIIETLQFLQQNCKAGDIKHWLDKGKQLLATKSKPEYLTIATIDTLKPTELLEKGKEYRAFVVAHIGNVRLIDNIEIFV